MDFHYLLASIFPVQEIMKKLLNSKARNIVCGLNREYTELKEEFGAKKVITVILTNRDEVMMYTSRMIATGAGIYGNIGFIEPNEWDLMYLDCFGKGTLHLDSVENVMYKFWTEAIPYKYSTAEIRRALECINKVAEIKVRDGKLRTVWDVIGNLHAAFDLEIYVAEFSMYSVVINNIN